MTERRRPIVLATLCLCAFAVNLDVTLVNVTLPRLVVDLGAGTRDLQWIVDAYTLTFAALVLAAGSLGAGSDAGRPCSSGSSSTGSATARRR